MGSKLILDNNTNNKFTLEHSDGVGPITMSTTDFANAITKAAEAASSAEAAGLSASNASSSATQSSGYASAANTSASNANTSELAALASSNSASGYASDAAVSAATATTNSDVYADTTAGIAGTVSGEQFQVISGDMSLRYLNNTGVAEYLASYPTAAINNIKGWTEYSTLVSNSYGSLAHTGTPYTSTRYVGPNEPTQYPSIAQNLEITLTTTTTLRLVLVQLKKYADTGYAFYGNILYEKNMAGLTAGTHTIDLENTFIPSGTLVLARRSSGGIDGDATVAGSVESTSGLLLGDNGQTVVYGINRALAMKLNVLSMTDNIVGRQAIKGGDSVDIGYKQKSDIDIASTPVITQAAASSNVPARLR
jgi:hypothetical protein